jgi:stage V sporulation protein G
MEITEVRIKLIAGHNDKLKGFCSITIDNCFVVRDIKIIEGDDGPFVAMPSRKMTDRCPKCGGKNHLRASFCSECGGRLDSNRESRIKNRAKLHADIAHPINSDCREKIQSAIIDAFHIEVDASKQEGYVPSYASDGFDD